MKVITLLESVSRADGGIFESECALQRELFLGQGVNVEVIGLEDRFTAEDLPRWLPLKPRAFKTRGPEAFGYSPDLFSSLDAKADLLYAATLWKYPSWAALQWAQKTDKPMMVAPHGSLDSWALKNSTWKKNMAAMIFKERQLQNAACLRALCESEAHSFRDYGLMNPIAIIPNGVDLPLGNPLRNDCMTANDSKRLLFLGRIHPKKGLMNLIHAFAQIRAAADQEGQTWQLVIAGWDQGGHEAELLQLCNGLGLKSAVTYEKQRPGQPKLKVDGEKRVLSSRLSNPDSEVIFYGPAFGEEKERLLRSTDAFILPSFSEGLPMSVLEAWSHGLPVLMTPECNLSEGYDRNAAIRIGTKPEAIINGLNALLSMSRSDLSAMGMCGCQLVKESFTWRCIGNQMKQTYEWLLGGGSLPSWIMPARL